MGPTRASKSLVCQNVQLVLMSGDEQIRTMSMAPLEITWRLHFISGRHEVGGYQSKKPILQE